MEQLNAEQLRLLKIKVNEKAVKDADRHFALITNYMRKFHSQKMTNYEKQNLKQIKEIIEHFLMNDLNK
jgi:hypothetical protein